MEVLDRFQHAWNAFMNRDPTIQVPFNNYQTYRPDRPRLSHGNERSIVTSIFNRIALDVASLDIKHCRIDEDGNYIDTIKSSLNNCLNIEANIDQTGRAFIQDIVISLLDEGCVAVVPIETDLDPEVTGSYDIFSMRTGKIVDWYPDMVKVELYDERIGMKRDVLLKKNMVAIIENPLYSVINEPNSTVKRLMRKLNLLDVTDEQTASGKLDLIIQLPYTVKTPLKREQAENRRKDIEMQLAGSKYGIAYTDGIEKITQLNRSVENNLLQHIEYLTNTMFGQLGITQSILDGTADDKTMMNYYTRSVEPIVAAIVDEMKRKFLTKTARTRFQSIKYFRDPFKLVPVTEIAEIADKLTRNEIMTSNEIRQKIAIKPSKDPKADELRNSNMPRENAQLEPPVKTDEKNDEGGDSQNG